MKTILEILEFIPNRFLNDILKKLRCQDLKEVQEIRIRCNKPICIKTNNEKIFINDINENLLTAYDLKEIVQKLSGYSLYSFEEELSTGYFTIQGGHRVGFCGRAVVKNGEVKTLHKISSLNIRIAHEIKDCSKEWVNKLFDGESLCHTFIISPVGCGKTTFLRDLIRQLSSRNYTVGVVDERGEISPMKNGVPQMDLGDCVDVQENCPKNLGMDFLLRSMSPDVIAVDELGNEADFIAIEKLVHSGVKILATLHGESADKFINGDRVRDIFKIIKGQGRILVLSGVGNVSGVFNI